jgi:hypothetical protein
MNRPFYFYVLGILFLLAIGWLLECSFTHENGTALILHTTSITETNRIRTELMNISAQTAAIKTVYKNAKPLRDTDRLSHLLKVSYGKYAIDTAQVVNSQDSTATWWHHRLKQLNLQLLTLPVYCIADSLIHEN